MPKRRQEDPTVFCTRYWFRLGSFLATARRAHPSCSNSFVWRCTRCWFLIGRIPVVPSWAARLFSERFFRPQNGAPNRANIEPKSLPRRSWSQIAGQRHKPASNMEAACLQTQLLCHTLCSQKPIGSNYTNQPPTWQPTWQPHAFRQLLCPPLSGSCAQIALLMMTWRSRF